MESEGGKGGAGGEQNLHEQLQGGQRNLCPLQHVLCESKSSGFRKKANIYFYITDAIKSRLYILFIISVCQEKRLVRVD